MAQVAATTKRSKGRPKGAIPPKQKYYHYLLRLPPELSDQIREQATQDDRDFRHHLMRLIKIGLKVYQPSDIDVGASRN
jgi:hypothetical protein